MSRSAKRVPETILDVENQIQTTLTSLSKLPLNDELSLGLSYLTRPGYKTVVQLEEDGRKKRSTAAASNWNPDSGEVVIFFEKIRSTDGANEIADDSLRDQHNQAQPTPRSAIDTGDASKIKECCEALALAEKAGKPFVALKWFRDEALANSDLAWVSRSEERQRILSLAIEQGAIRTARIPNPKNPDFPTTTISLNHFGDSSAVKSRFNPIPIKGEPMSVTLLRDRGSY